MNLPRPINDASEIQSDLLSRVFVWWRTKAGARPAPNRDEISPSELKFALPSLWMWQVEDGGADFTFRLGGEHVRNFMGPNFPYRRLSEFPKSEFANEVRLVFGACVTTRTPLIVGPARTTYELRNYRTVTNIVLPVFDNGVDVATLLGVTEIEESVARQPA